jgi:hypothetical protein
MTKKTKTTTIKIGQYFEYQPLDLGFGDCGTEAYVALSEPYKTNRGWFILARRALTGAEIELNLERCFI